VHLPHHLEAVEPDIEHSDIFVDTEFKSSVESVNQIRLFSVNG